MLSLDVAQQVASKLKHLPDVSAWARTCRAASESCTTSEYERVLQSTFVVVSNKHNVVLDRYSQACWSKWSPVSSRVVWWRSANDSYDTVRERPGLQIRSAEFKVRPASKRRVNVDHNGLVDAKRGRWVDNRRPPAATYNVRSIAANGTVEMRETPTAYVDFGTAHGSYLVFQLMNGMSVRMNIPTYWDEPGVAGFVSSAQMRNCSIRLVGSCATD